MAISAACAWEVRSTATAGNLNGGGFVAGGGGTDYSQQDAAQYNFTDLAATSATGASPSVTSASHNFVAADVGNLIHITAGTNWTVGWYQIVSVAANAATLDRACASVASPTAGTYYVGGAISLGTSGTHSDSVFFAAPQPGNTIHMKLGTYSPPNALSAGTAGTTANVTKLIGYQSARGDTPTTAATRPTMNSGANGMTFAASWEVRNVNFTNTATNSVTTGNNSKFINCRAINSGTTTSQNAFVTSNQAILFNCEAISYRGNGISTSSNTFVTIDSCYIHESDIGITCGITGSQVSVLNCIIEGCVTKAINLSGAITGRALIRGNTLYGAENKRGTAVSIATGSNNISLINNIIYGFTTGVSHADAQTIGFDEYNNYSNNTADVSNWTKGSTTLALAPSFTSMTQLTGTAATTSASILTDGAASFTNVVDGQDFLYLVSGTGITAGMYKITAHTATTLTVDIAPGTSAVADKVYSIGLGHNFTIGVNLQAVAAPGTFQAGLTVDYTDIGAAQRRLDLPSQANTKTGVVYDNLLKTGTYDGSDRWTDPAIANVRSGTAYKANSTSNNRTGTVAIPAAADVRSGTSVDATTGTLDLPSTANVKTGVTFDGASKTGTYDGSDRWTDPAIANVRSGTAYKANSTSNNRTGTVVIPSAGDVRSGTSFDTSSTGTLDLPATSAVKTGVTFDGSSKTGTYDGSDRWTDPGDTNVKLGITYKANSTSANKTGLYAAAEGPTASEIAAAVWDELAAGHADTGSFGELVASIDGGAAVDPDTIAAAVWNAETADFTTASTFGTLIKKLLTVGKFLGLK